MCKKTARRFFNLMGWVTLIVAIAMLIGLFIRLFASFGDGSDAWTIISTILNILAVGTLGCGFSTLFMYVGEHNCRAEKE